MAPTSRVLSSRHLLSFLALFSGIGLLAQILLNLSLRYTLAAAAAVAGLAVVFFWQRAAATERAAALAQLKAGLLAGLLATFAYDFARLALSRWDATPYNPFETITVFGQLFAGADAPSTLIIVTGSAYHFLNGISFGVAYAFAFGRRGPLAGILWALFLETFQLALYPGWLDIRFYGEFVQISFLAHVAYGATLGSLCRRALNSYDASTKPASQ